MTLREMRKKEKLTQKKLASALNVTSQTIAHYECGTRMPSVCILKAYAKILRVSLEELIDAIIKKSTS